jgi:hypothetical protein
MFVSLGVGFEELFTMTVPAWGSQTLQTGAESAPAQSLMYVLDAKL